MAFEETDEGPVTVSPTIADTSAAEAIVAQSFEPPTGAGDPVTAVGKEAEREGSVVLEFEPHAANARASSDMETSVDVRTIDLVMPNRAGFELETVLDHGQRFAGGAGERDAVPLDLPRDGPDLDEPGSVMLRVALGAEGDGDGG
jgi:hypothetical protein